MKKLFGNISGKIINTLTSVRFIVTVAGLVVVATLAAWQYHSITNADRVFWGMVDDNLHTSSYTRLSVQKSGGQGVEQITSATTEPKQRVYGETLFTQTGADAATATTENIGTTTQDFVRYTNITTNQKSSNGNALDFSKVLGVWGASEPEGKDQTNGQLYNQAVLGIIPVGNLSSAQRHALIAEMKAEGAYEFKIAQTTRSLPFGRPTYVFQVTVNPVSYIKALKSYAKYVGLTHLEEINPNDYSSSQKLLFTVSVDGWTHQMTQTSQSQGGKNEIITGRNLKKSLPEPPTDTISVDELQTRLQSIN
jgi:hypothetical protein